MGNLINRPSAKHLLENQCRPARGAAEDEYVEGQAGHPVGSQRLDIFLLSTCALVYGLQVLYSHFEQAST